MVQIGECVPDFELNASGGKQLKLSDFRGKFLVVYFYPKDNTSGCTAEATDFTSQIEDFRALNCEILGVSKDSVKSHDKFINDHGLAFDLLSDPEETACKIFDAIKEKSMYGRKYMGIDRSTFLLDREGRLIREWRGVKVKGHVAAVLAELKSKALS